MPSDDRDMFEALKRRAVKAGGYVTWSHFRVADDLFTIHLPDILICVAVSDAHIDSFIKMAYGYLDSLAPCPEFAGLRAAAEAFLAELDKCRNDEGFRASPEFWDAEDAVRAALAPPATEPDCDECTGLEKALTDIWVYAVEQGPNYGKQRPLSDYNRGAQEAFIEVAVMLHAALEGDGTKGKKLIAGRDVFGAPTLAPAAPPATKEEINENESD